MAYRCSALTRPAPRAGQWAAQRRPVRIGTARGNRMDAARPGCGARRGRTRNVSMRVTGGRLAVTLRRGGARAPRWCLLRGSTSGATSSPPDGSGRRARNPKLIGQKALRHTQVPLLGIRPPLMVRIQALTAARRGRLCNKPLAPIVPTR